METRALAIAFFYAIGTAIGGITGPLLFAKLIGTGEASQVAIGFYLGAAVMAIGGLVEIFFGVKAEQQELEDVAKPLTAEEAEGEAEAGEEPREGAPDRPREAAAARARERARLRRARFGPGSISSSPRHVRLGADPQGPARPRGRADRPCARRARHDRSRPAGSPRGRALMGPGRYAAALREAVASGRATRVGRSSFAPARRERSEAR